MLSKNRSFAFSVAFFGVASFLGSPAGAQTEPAARPKIRLSSSDDAAAPAEAQPAEKQGPDGEAPAAKASVTAASGVKQAPAAEPGAEETAIPETPESAVGVQPTAGLGPAAPAVGSEGVEIETEEEPSAVSEPRIIDVSADKDAPPPVEDPETPGSELPFTYHMNHVDVSGGFRFAGTPNEGLEPFMVDPVFADVYIRGGMAFAIADRIAIAPHIELGGGSASANVRSLPSQLDKAHVSLGLEGRYHFIHRMFGYVRVAPGIEIVNATIDLEGIGTELTSENDWPGSVAFQLDAALGASIRLFGPNDGQRRVPRLWAFAEGGYRASGKHELTLSVAEGEGPPRSTSVDLAPLNLSGGFFSTGLMASF